MASKLNVAHAVVMSWAPECYLSRGLHLK